MTSDIAIKADSPIRIKKADLLNRAGMAASVAEFIERSCDVENPRDESLVAGIEGEWGSGKTSFINLILENLKPEEPELPKFLIIEFNPWNFSDQNELITDFFQSIVVGLESDKTLKGNTFETVRKIKRYFPKLLERSNVNFGIPGVLSVGLDLEGMTGDPLERQKKEINGLLAKIGKPIVIVIDDIDRLDARETRLVFKLVRMTANFTNTVFLLAYDRGKVGKRITENGIEGEEFLKKIVQLSFPLPRVDQHDLFGILLGELDEIIGEFDDKNWNRGRWESLFDSCLKKFFRTIRDVRRYVNGLRLDLKIISAEEVNPIDFLATEAIRIFAPDVYFAMANEKSAFAFPASDRMYEREDFSDGFVQSDSQDEKARKRTCEETVGKAPEDLTEAVRETVKWLFPQVSSLYPGGSAFRGQDMATWRKQLMVCSEGIFDKYFSLSVTSSALSEKSLKDFLSTLDDMSASADKLEKFEEEGKARLVLERLLDHLDGLNARQRENLLVLVLDFTEDTTGRGPSFFRFQSRESQVSRLCHEILKRIPSQERPELAARVLDSSRGVFSPAYIMDSFYQRLQDVEEGKLQESPLFAREAMCHLNGICIGKIEEAAKNGSLADHKRLSYALSYWKKRGTENAAKDYVAGLLKTEDDLFRFLMAFDYEESFQTVGDPSERITRKILREEIVKFVDLDELDGLVRDLDERDLSPEKAELLKLYKNSTESF